MLANLMFSILNYAAKKGVQEARQASSSKHVARQTGVKGETYAYWYLRRQGYTPVARNYMVAGIKGEIDIVAYDGPVLVFVEVKTRSATGESQARPEEAVNHDKRRNLSRMARQFLRSRRLESATCRFDVLAIETRPGQKPTVRLHKDAFGMGGD
ncbi:MAG: YraN family protein [Candidatus Acidiferrales bacterium]